MEPNFKFKIILSVLINFLFFQNAYSSVNIISWWNYVDKNTISALQKKCNTNISLDEYYSSDDFLRRYKKQRYSIIIFPAEVYNLVLNKIEKDGVNFKKTINKYHPNVLLSFKGQNLSNNIAIFSLGVTGFLFDPNKIQIDRNEELKKIFLKAKNKKIALIDDPFESLHLISFENKFSAADEGVKELKHLVEGTSFIITNDLIKFVKEKDFAFAYTWIGAGFKRISENPHLKFTALPKISFISADFIAALEKDPQTECVAKMLASKEFLNPILERTTYFSPYGLPSHIENKDFALEYETFIHNHYQFKWLPRANKEEYHKMQNLWQRIKISVKDNYY